MYSTKEEFTRQLSNETPLSYFASKRLVDKIEALDALEEAKKIYKTNGYLALEIFGGNY